jgi:hypothetical protein
MSSPHPSIDAYMQRRGIPRERLRADGRLTLSHGERYRMHMVPLPGGRLLFEARIAAVPAEAQARDRKIDGMLRIAAQRMATSPEACVLDRQAGAFLLQWTAANDLGPVAFDAAVELFFRSVVFWKHAEEQA